MKSKYNIVFLIALLMVVFSLVIAVVNSGVFFRSSLDDLKERSLPLTIDNIYTEIQKNIIEPNLVSSMMAHDNFMKDWLINKEDDVDKISTYLESIKSKYNFFSAFLVSEKTSNYYTENGFMEKIEKDNKNNSWYFRFLDNPKYHEINLDFNEKIDDSLIVFINHKVLDEENNLIGVIGVGLKISYINEMLKHFRQQYDFNVYFIDSSGEVVLSELDANPLRNLDDVPELSAIKDLVISKGGEVVEYEKMDEYYLIKTKYIPELDLYLVVEAKLSKFLAEIKNTFYFNLISILLITIIVALLILKTVINHHDKLSVLASYDDLTQLKNRRVFNEELNHVLLLNQRKKNDLSLLFFDLDDFKYINDTLGHQVGDDALKAVADILKKNIRRTDILGRWGGEEFIIAFIDTDVDGAGLIAEKLREQIEHNDFLQQLLKQKLTASFGLTSLKPQDSLDTLLRRADKALYQAKKKGKNQVVCV